MANLWVKLDPTAPVTYWDSAEALIATQWDADPQGSDVGLTVWDLKLVQIDNWTKQHE